MSGAVHKLGIFLPNWVGDLVMATPSLRALREGFPRAEIVGVVRPPLGSLLEGTGLIDRTLDHAPRGADSEHRGWRFLRRLRGERFDAVVLYPNSLRSAWWGWWSGAPIRVGLDRNGRGLFLTPRVPAPDRRMPHPVIDDYGRLAAALGLPVPPRRLELATTPADERLLAEFWGRQPAAAQQARSRGYVALNTGGAFGAAKDWPAESFAALARRIAGELGRAVLVLCGPAERDNARRIAARARDARVVSLAEAPLGLGLSKAAVRHAELLVTTDSGPRHFAHAFGVPAVVLFGPTHPAWSETGHPRSVGVQLALACGPCQQRTCPLGHHECMRGLSVERVFGEVQRMLGPSAARGALCA